MTTNNNQRLTLVNIGSFTNQDVNVYMLYRPTDALYNDFRHNGCYLGPWISLFDEISKLVDALTDIYDVAVRDWTINGVIDNCPRHDRRVYSRTVCNRDITRNNKHSHFHVEPYCDRGESWSHCGAVSSVPHTPHKIWIDMANGVVDLAGLSMIIYPEYIPSEFTNSYNTAYQSRYNWNSIKFADFRSVLHEIIRMHSRMVKTQYSRMVDKKRVQFITFRDGSCGYVTEFFD